LVTSESAAIDVAKFLLEEQANLFVYDPKVPEVEITKISEKIRVEKDPYTAAFEAHAVVILTEWDEFKSLDYERIFRNMQKPAFLFDGRLLLNHRELRAIGYQVHAIGKSIVGNDYKRVQDN
jgi:UDPglucose 6-dehydrogenase